MAATPNQILYANEIISRCTGDEIVGAEIGVMKGETSAVLLKNPRLAWLYMVDSWAPQEEQPAHYRATGDYYSCLSREDQNRNCQLAHEATEFAADRRSILRLESTMAAATIEDGILDFAFIDADHSEAGCYADIVAWLPKVKPGGLLCGHDYNREGNRDPSWQNTFGVTLAVDRAVAEHGWELELGKDFTWFVRL